MAQPDVAGIMLNDRLLVEQGLLSRFLITAPDSAAGLRLWHEPKPESGVLLKRYGARLLGILEEPFLLATGKSNELEPRCLTLSSGARGLWIASADHVERAIAPNGALEPVRGLANKLPEHAARLAAILALVDDLGAPEIGANHMRAGIALAEHRATEALRLFGASRVNSELRLAQKLLDWLLGTWPEPAISLPDIYQRSLNTIGDKATAAKLIAILEDHEWLVRIPEGAVVPGASFGGPRNERVPEVRRHTSKRAADPTRPKPPKAPKDNPSEPVGLPVLGGLGALGTPTLKSEISPHAATPPPSAFSARAIWDDFKDEGAANGEYGSDMPLAGTAIIAPGKWVERIAVPASSEPGFSEPWLNPMLAAKRGTSPASGRFFAVITGRSRSLLHIRPYSSHLTLGAARGIG